MKANYVKPTTQVIDFCSETELLAASPNQTSLGITDDVPASSELPSLSKEGSFLDWADDDEY